MTDRFQMTIDDINSPMPDRDLACAAYLRDSVEALIAAALAAGWSADEVDNALLGLVQDRIADSRDRAVLDGMPDQREH